MGISRILKDPKSSVIPPVTISLLRIFTIETDTYGIGIVVAESTTMPCKTPIFGMLAGLNPLPPRWAIIIVENISMK